METDFMVTMSVQGVTEDFARTVGETLIRFVREFEVFEEGLDFRRMHQIIVTTDLAAQLDALSSRTASGTPITHTNEEYGVAVGKVLLLPRGEGIEILPVLHAGFVSLLTQTENQVDQEDVQSALHLLHHELCHVHDDNKKLDALEPFILKHFYGGKDKYIRSLAERCWSEYIANRLSASTASQRSITEMTECLTDAIGRTKPVIDEEIRKYRFHGDTGQLMDLFQRHGAFLPTIAAYCLGYVDGLETSLEALDEKAGNALVGSYFELNWKGMHSALKEMHGSYLKGWKDLSAFDPLAEVIESYYEVMGLILTTTEAGGCWMDVPFRSETD